MRKRNHLRDVQLGECPSVGIIAGGIFALVVSFPSFAVQRYIAVPLGTLGGSTSKPTAINNNGAIVGFSFTKDDLALRAFLHDGTRMIDLGTFAGGPNSNSSAQGINDKGEITGSSDIPGSLPGSVQHAFVYSDGRMRDLGTFQEPQSFRKSVGNGINVNAHVVGGSQTFNLETHAFLYSGTTLMDLGIPSPASSYGDAINANDEVVGHVVLAVGQGTRGFIYAGNVILDIGTLESGHNSAATAINSNGWVTGWSDVAAGDLHAILYTNGAMRDLGNLGGNYAVGRGINDSGQIVGESQRGDRTPRGFIYTEGAMYDLTDLVDAAPALSITAAEAINNTGQIAAIGCGKISCSAYRLDPIPKPPASNGGGGGCGMIEGPPRGPIDPTFLMFLAIATLALLIRGLRPSSPSASGRK